MSARGFGSVLWAGAVAGAALSFYLVSLRVASERAQLEDVEGKIALAQRDIRLLQTELGTRGRLAQLERWNVRFIRLSAPNAEQFVDGGFQLAALVRPDPRPVTDAPIVLASATKPEQMNEALTNNRSGDADAPSMSSRPASELVHVASYSVPSMPATDQAGRHVSSPVAENAKLKPLAPAKPATKPAKSAMADPPSPLPDGRTKGKGATPASRASGKKSPTDTKAR